MVWVGTYQSGLYRINPSTNELKNWNYKPDDPNSLSNNFVTSIIEDDDGYLWISTYNGLNKYNLKSNNNTFLKFYSDPNNKNSISNNLIWEISKSDFEPDILWIGTANGLNKFVIKNDSGSSDGSKLSIEIKFFTVADGFPDNAVESILEDENGNLWIGTSTGITFFDIKEERFTNFTVSDGLSGSSFNSSAAFKTAEGIMLFGCTNGLNYFNPYRIKQSAYSPPVVITDFKIFNQPAGNNGLSSSNSGIFNLPEVSLSYNQNDFSFQFASLDYNAPEMNQYAYFMEGFDKDWIYSGKRRFVTYTNLYVPLPGGSGFLPEILCHWAAVCLQGVAVLGSCGCEKACYRCLLHFRNQQFHGYLGRLPVD